MPRGHLQRPSRARLAGASSPGVLRPWPHKPGQGPQGMRRAPPSHLDGVSRVVVTVEVLDRDLRTVHGAWAVGLPHALKLVLCLEGWLEGDPGHPRKPFLHLPSIKHLGTQGCGPLQVPGGAPEGSPSPKAWPPWGDSSQKEGRPGLGGPDPLLPGQGQLALDRWAPTLRPSRTALGLRPYHEYPDGRLRPRHGVDALISDEGV